MTGRRRGTWPGGTPARVVLSAGLFLALGACGDSTAHLASTTTTTTSTSAADIGAWAPGTTAGTPTASGSPSATALPTSTSPAVTRTATPKVTPSPVPTLARARSAAVDLAPYLARARRLDTQLRTLAAEVNACFKGSGVVTSPRAEVLYAEARRQFDQLEPTLPTQVDGLLRDALVRVHADLASRLGSMRDFAFAGQVFGEGPDTSAESVAFLVGALGKGQPAARLFGRDIATAEWLARNALRLRAVPSDAVVRLETAALLLQAVDGNLCCGSRGGDVPDRPYRVVWIDATGPHRTGTFDFRTPGVDLTVPWFTADLVRGQWVVEPTAG